MNTPKMIMMVGLPGSGKSHKAEELSKKYDATIFSSDALREEMFNDVNCQDKNADVFNELHKRIKEHLKSGNSTIMDATNISYKKRMDFLQSLNKIHCEKHCVFMAVPYEECLKHNQLRERKVPEEVIKKMYLSFNVPYWYEGWDNIVVEYADGSENSFDTPAEWLDSVMDFDQDNPHHTLTLGGHCLEALNKLVDLVDSSRERNIPELVVATLIHDNGKVFSKGYVNSYGSPCRTAHYYNHQFCGAYDSLFFDCEVDKLYVAQLIQWHMHPYLSWVQSQKSLNKDKKLLGKELFDDIMILHQADKAAH